MHPFLAWLTKQTNLDKESCRALTVEQLLPLLSASPEECNGSHEPYSGLTFYKEALDALPNPIFLKDDDLRYVFFNRAYRDFFGVDTTPFLGQQVLDLDYISHDARQRFRQEDQSVLTTQNTIQYETRFHVGDRQDRDAIYWTKGFTVASTGQRGVIGEIVDISKEKKLQHELARQKTKLERLMNDAKEDSRHDPCTRLYNRHILTDSLPALLDNAILEGVSIWGLLIDIDDFKAVNDTYGHVIGDNVLTTFADIMRASFRQNDLVFRYGGDEFAAVLLGVSLQQTNEIAERFRNQVCGTLLLPNGDPVTISIGIAEYQHGEDMVAFLTRTDRALYLAKKLGKNKVAVI